MKLIAKLNLITEYYLKMIINQLVIKTNRWTMSELVTLTASLCHHASRVRTSLATLLATAIAVAAKWDMTFLRAVSRPPQLIREMFTYRFCKPYI